MPIILLLHPTEREIEVYNKMVAEKDLFFSSLKPLHQTTTLPKGPMDDIAPDEIEEWMSGIDFETALAKKGYRYLRSLSSKKAICEKYKIAFRKFGREYHFKNDLHRIPDKIRLSRSFGG